MSSIEFYYAPGACSLAPHILLQETRTEFKATAMRVSASRTSFPPSFKAINPKNQVPVLVLDGTAITEVPAIATAISGLAPGLHLMGRTPRDTAAVYEWMNWLSGTLHGAGYGHYLRPGRWTTSESQDVLEGIKSAARERIEGCYDHIEGKLGGVYAVGGHFTAVDAYMFVFYRWGNDDVGLDMRERWPKYAALVENLVKRDAVRAALKAEGIGSTL